MNSLMRDEYWEERERDREKRKSMRDNKRQIDDIHSRSEFRS